STAWSRSCTTRRPPPRSTLFPYTTLFRSSRRISSISARPEGILKVYGSASCTQSGRHRGRDAPSAPSASPSVRIAHPVTRTRRRSEEHTSELQSRENLVCRLLLEKKNKTH